jgi:phosphopantetheine adenylyltransferase
MKTTVRVAFPGSFDPPTIAHLAVARAAHEHLGGARVDWIVSRIALGKTRRTGPTFEERVEVLRVAAEPLSWLSVAVTEAQFIADIAHGYDAVVIGADKWRQVIDPGWYTDAAECARMQTRLPRVLVVPRASDDLTDLGAAGAVAGLGNRIELLRLPDELREVSSSAARSGARALMLPAALAHADRTGHWACD